MDGIGGYNGWRWIFIIEGLATIVLAAIAKFFIADWPEQAKFLTPEERAIVVRRTREDMVGAKMDRLGSKARRRIFYDWKIWCGCVLSQSLWCTVISRNKPANATSVL